MPIVTLTTDFGLQDYYVPVLKGAMLVRHKELNFIDISHNIKNHDIVQGRFYAQKCLAPLSRRYNPHRKCQ